MEEEIDRKSMEYVKTHNIPMEDAEEVYCPNLGRPVNTAEDKWRLIPAFVKSRGLVRQHIDSFNYFIDEEIRQIVRANDKVTCDADSKFYLKYLDVWVHQPCVEENYKKEPITPMECRLRDLSYTAPIQASIEFTRDKKVYRKTVTIGYMPIMLQSKHCVLYNNTFDQFMKHGECPMDPGGYFVVKGVERVILSQEQMSKNRILIETSSQGFLSASVTSATHEVKSRTVVYLKRGKLYLKHNSLTEDVPVMIIIKAMGMESDMEFLQFVGNSYTSKMINSIEECKTKNVLNQREALRYVGNHLKIYTGQKGYISKRPKVDEARDVLANLILPHIEVLRYNFKTKIIYIALMVSWILKADETGELDDKDYYGNKRMELAGQMMSLLFEDLFKQFNTELQTIATKELSKKTRSESFDILKHISPHRITTGLIHALSTGNWVLKRFNMDRAGVTQVLSRLSYISALGMMTRLNSHFEKTRKVSGPRSLQGSQWGMVCPSDTPEGESCGLVKNFSLLTEVTTDSDDQAIMTMLFNLGVEDANLISGDELNSENSYLVFLNGQLLGIHQNPIHFLRQCRVLRRHGRLGKKVSLHLNETQRSINISSDGGRVCRPLIVVENAKSKIGPKEIRDIVEGFKTIEDCIKDGMIEYLDVNEENNSYIAIYENQINEHTTHLEIDPLSILGVVAGLIPYPHHNQSPRNTYQCAMGKQAIGTIGYNQFKRIDTLLYLLYYPQVPMVRTKTIDMINFDKVPAGENAMVAVMSYSGYDIEDASILNKASIDRGYQRCFVYRKADVVIKKYRNGMSDRVVCPTDEERAMKKYKVLDFDGVCSPGTKLMPGMIYLNKQAPNNTTRPITTDVPTDEDFRREALTYKGSVPSYVDKVLITSSDEEPLKIKIGLRTSRRPELGDKFSSRHGQKGVTGLIVKQEDMPFTGDGICPDVIMNPHGFPSRMTVGKMLELVSGKAGLMDGTFKYGTAFGGDKLDDMSKILIESGYSYDGKEVLYSGITGKTLRAYIFIGPVYYQKLKHMVLDKMHARARGPKSSLTRQPTEGRSRDGGLRLGEMERDCLIGYGASNLLLERLMYSSDAFKVTVCRKCGLMGYCGYCKYCQSSLNCSTITMPYACKLLFQEMQSMNVVPRLSFRNV
ncbi:DNA-directed RNA polymerase III subunit RPC2, putative [Entamoeba invadens IP1]|uniref:DNA-directed RNA polymerase III subunit RPC2, putative n=1 Tax=Entamoeba invadens IP1 TaxID=370355 RepID=UPI0002C3FB96|nr:DNA-directed RNA polymerase III subunit RPC2, putative [Entamoeba invadens IP1]ELP90581.1 DNA-directed RNA polymerase III subunit RPC2, putative [Entamoeba invadens IP1]|eukprot:XP_004257352.1 DNA-directed RNA polymerase III subunit RPC2, putative [Entamoeba invadens IP1]